MLFVLNSKGWAEINTGNGGGGEGWSVQRMQHLFWRCGRADRGKCTGTGRPRQKEKWCEMGLDRRSWILSDPRDAPELCYLSWKQGEASLRDLGRLKEGARTRTRRPAKRPRQYPKMTKDDGAWTTMAAERMEKVNGFKRNLIGEISWISWLSSFQARGW